MTFYYRRWTFECPTSCFVVLGWILCAVDAIVSYECAYKPKGFCCLNTLVSKCFSVVWLRLFCVFGHFVVCT